MKEGYPKNWRNLLHTLV